MKQKISFIKSNNALLIFSALIAIMLLNISITTESFTAFPDFEGSAKAIIADILLIPSTFGILIMFYVFLRFPKKIELNQTTSTVMFDGYKLDNPIEVTIHGNNREKAKYRLTLKSRGKEILKTGFIYKIENEVKGKKTFVSGNSQMIIFIENNKDYR